MHGCKTSQKMGNFKTNIKYQQRFPKTEMPNFHKTEVCLKVK